MWGFGDLGIWGFGDLGIWGFGDLGILGLGILGFWDFGIMGFGDLGISPPRHVRRKISASVDGGPSRGSRVRRPGSEDPHRR